MKQSQAILWQNQAETVTLIDVPRSIATAQGQDTSTFRHLLSSPPLEVPFASNEPKSAAAKAKLETNTVEARLHAEYNTVLQKALDEVKANHSDQWSLARPFVEGASLISKKRKPGGDPNNISAGYDFEVLAPDNSLMSVADGLLTSLARSEGVDFSVSLQLIPEDPTLFRKVSQEAHEQRFFSNDGDWSISLKSSSSHGTCVSQIPPKASFYLGDCADSRSFHTAIRNQAQEADTRKVFDFILLDPPWPNRSVKRTHKTPGNTYNTISTLWDVRNLLLDMDLDLLMADNCLLAIWITNKPAVRDLVLGEDGIFACWGVVLVEEWLWLKTTVHGEPVAQLEALWRKPYEVLLLGRKRRRRFDPDTDSMKSSNKTELTRRVIISVPDLHSRKPCLKELVEPLLQKTSDYRVLEVFARHLVAGWWSWGDECIKFNREGYWRDFVDDGTNDDQTEDLNERFA